MKMPYEHDDIPPGITNAQIRCIYAVARKLGLTDDDLHALVMRIAGVEHIKQLAIAQAKGVIDHLMDAAGEDKNVTRPGKPTPNQLLLINTLTEKLGWDAERQRAFLEKRFKISHIRFLDDKRAWKVIEAMKAMLKGGRGERRLAPNDPDPGVVTQR